MTFPKLFGANSTAMSKFTRQTLPALAIVGFVLGASLSPSVAASAIGFNQNAALRLVNNFRAENGAAPLRLDSQLMQVARTQSNAMADRNKVGHSVAGSLSSRMRNGGVKYSAIAENIGAGQSTFAAAMNRWIRSPGHRKNILRSNLTSIGFAGSQNGGRNYWTQVFSAPPRSFISGL